MAYDFTFEYPYPPLSRSVARPRIATDSNRRAEPSHIQLPSVQAAFPDPSMPSLQNGQHEAAAQAPPPPMTMDPSFDIIDWHPAYQSCQRFILDEAQFEQATQAVCALINIRLPFQYARDPILSWRPPGSASPARAGPSSSDNGHYTHSYPPSNGNTPRNGLHHQSPPACVSLVPYLRRLVVTGFDKPAILHGFFGNDYTRGILPHLDCERRNYLFAARQGGWRNCKALYDTGSGMGGDETVPFLNPLDNATIEELVAAEKAWNSWSKMEDWSIGPGASLKTSLKQEDKTSGVNLAGVMSDTGESQRVADNLPDGVPQAFEGCDSVG